MEAVARGLRAAAEAAAVAATAAAAASGGVAPAGHASLAPPLELALLLAPQERLFCMEAGRFFEAGSVAGALRTMEAGLQALAEAHSGGSLRVTLRVGQVA